MVLLLVAKRSPILRVGTMGNRGSAQPDARVVERAEAWSQRIAKGPLGADEARAFNEWMTARPEHEEAFLVAQALRQEFNQIRELPEYASWIRPSFYERLMGAITLRGAPKLRWSIAATSLAAAFAVAIVSLSPPETKLPPTPPTPAVETMVAEVREEVLPDGSVVTLGAASSIRVEYSEGERRVVLAKGEAFFDVEEDAERPFIVAAQNTFVRVLGTKFDVSLSSDAIDVAVSEGRVEVIRPDTPRTEITERDVKHVLTAGQQVRTPTRGRVEPVEQVDVEDVASWRRGELVWTDTPIRDIVSDLNRYSEAEIELRASGVADLEYTLAIQVEDVPIAVDLIAMALELRVEERSDGRIIIR